MLKGFPNQLNNLTKLSRALAVIARLEDTGGNARDDAIMGMALVRDGILGTGHTPQPIEEYLAKYQSQPSSKRPYQTTARGLREFFRYSGCLVEDAEANEAWLTPLGRQLATHTHGPLTVAEKAAWRVTIGSIRIGDPNRGYSHPYRVLLRLIERIPGLPTGMSPLAFEANDDSDAELDRIASLVDLGNEDVVRERIGGETLGNWDNAKKVLPGIGEQLSDILRNNGQLTLLTQPLGSTRTNPLQSAPYQSAHRLVSPTISPPHAPRPGRRGRSVTALQIARAGTGTPVASDETLTASPDPAVMAAAITIRAVRLTRHNNIVRMLAALLEAGGASLMEDPFDCLATKGHRSLMFEIKTLDGTQPDEIDRVRDALGQLLYYSSFSIPTGCPDPSLIALFELRPSDAHIDWLNRAGIMAAWIEDESIIAPQIVNDFVRTFLAELNS